MGLGGVYRYMRRHAEWMVALDERILEFLDEFGNHQPAEIAAQLGDLGAGMDYHPKYVGQRCRQLTDAGLLLRHGRGVYSITDDGQAFLAGDLDAGALETPE